MTSTIDVNVLVYASDRDSPFHDQARTFVDHWSSGPELVYIFWPTVMGYLRISTHPRIFAEPIDPETARENISSLLALPYVRTGSEAEDFWSTWLRTTRGLNMRANLVSDAHVVALMYEHGVSEIWTLDRDFRKFDRIRVRDPFAD